MLLIGCPASEKAIKHQEPDVTKKEREFITPVLTSDTPGPGPGWRVYFGQPWTGDVMQSLNYLFTEGESSNVVVVRIPSTF